MSTLRRYEDLEREGEHECDQNSLYTCMKGSKDKKKIV